MKDFFEVLQRFFLFMMTLCLIQVIFTVVFEVVNKLTSVSSQKIAYYTLGMIVMYVTERVYKK